VRRGLVLALLLASCGKADAGPSSAKAPDGGSASEAGTPGASTLGTVEVTATLVDITGQFPPNKLYDYVYVMKYRVLRTHRGRAEGEEIFVGHYNPLKPRSGAEDKFSGKIGGNLGSFKVGDVHRLALEAPLDQHMPMVGLIDKYIREKGVRYWAVWTDRAAQ
jgi:hypothetical protein